MNFGDILDKWEKQRPSAGSSSDGEIQAKDTEERDEQTGAQEKRRRKGAAFPICPKYPRNS